MHAELYSIPVPEACEIYAFSFSMFYRSATTHSPFLYFVCVLDIMKPSFFNSDSNVCIKKPCVTTVQSVSSLLIVSANLFALSRERFLGSGCLALFIYHWTLPIAFHNQCGSFIFVSMQDLNGTSSINPDTMNSFSPKSIFAVSLLLGKELM